MSSADSDRWRAIEQALEAALQAAPEERRALLDVVSGSDPELRREVESLLVAHERAEGFLSTSAESFATPYLTAAAAREPNDRPGAIIGRYRLIEEIGRGGMGRVWLAERADGQFEQRVALKLVKRGMDTDEILARFLRERQILARLEHANIGRLLDGGVSDDGRPYFVMEQVVGRAVTQYCDDETLGIDARLKLFVVAARAVGFAHRNLVVHRDIKPSNVLVDDRGEIKLLDFGIAKLLDDREDAARRTGTIGRFLTPEYASPEQVAGMQVTTSSDVYQLGILLYELLTGRRPDAAKTFHTYTRRPSNAVRETGLVRRASDSERKLDPFTVSARRGTTVERLHRRLKGDLDAIVLRALREEPELRYPSAEDLAEDVERHLQHLPIRFGGDRPWYRANKFVRRHRLGVTSGAGVIALALALVTIDATRVRRERDRARYEADKATEAAQLMARFLQGWSPDASDRGEVSTKKLLADAAVRAARDLQSRPEMLAATLSTLGDFHTTVGEWRAADTLLDRAQSIQQSLGDRTGSDLASTLARRGRLYRLTGELPKASGMLQSALALDRALFGRKHAETLRVQRELASVFRDWQKFTEAEALLRDILTQSDDPARNPSPFALETASDLGYVLFQLGRFDDAVAILRPTLERQRALFGDLHASTLTTMRELGSTLRDRGELDEAESLYRSALRVARALYGEEHAETEGALFVLGLVLHRKNDLVAAEELMRQDLALAQRLYGADHYQVLPRLTGLAAIRLDRGDFVEAERLLRQVRTGMRRIAPEGGPDEGDVLNRLAYLLVNRGAPDANKAYRDAVSFDNARPADQADFVTDGLHFLAWAEQRKGDLAAAEVDYRRALAVYERQLPANHPYRLSAAEGLRALQAQRTKE